MSALVLTNASFFFKKDSFIEFSTFINIVEFDLDKDICDEEKEITDEHLYARLNSIANSIRNADRFYLKEILHDVALSYQYVDNDEDYEVAMELIKYNRRIQSGIDS